MCVRVFVCVCVCVRVFVCACVWGGGWYAGKTKGCAWAIDGDVFLSFGMQTRGIAFGSVLKIKPVKLPVFLNDACQNVLKVWVHGLLS